MKIIILALLVVQIFAQGGGGGGSRSSFSSGSSYYRSNYNRPSYYNSRSYTCKQQCNINLDPKCYEICMGSDSSQQTGGILAGILGGLCVCCASIFACFKCKCLNLPKCCKCHKYQELAREYNKIDQTSISLSQYISKRNHIIFLINQSSDINNFAFKQSEERDRIYAKVEIISEENYITQIKLSGSDKFGEWTAVGFILCRAGGQIFMWFYKEYNNKKAAGQTDEWEHLIFTSTKYSELEGMSGRWFYIGFEHSEQFSGEWRLFPKGQQNMFNQHNFHNAY